METHNQGWLFRMRANSANGYAPAQGRDPHRYQFRSVPRHGFGLRCALLCLGASTDFPSHISVGALDQLSDLTDKAAQAVVTLMGRDNFNSEYTYGVSVKNLSSDPLVGESLVIVLDKITNIGGDEWKAGRSESNLSRMEIPGQDGETDEGKPYFRIPR